MKIDEQRLDEMETYMNAVRGYASESERYELIRLARLGLWSLNHGVPALRDLALWRCTACEENAIERNKALNALPKGEGDQVRVHVSVTSTGLADAPKGFKDF